MFIQKITPNPYGPKAEQGMCLQYVRQAFGLPLRYGSATEAWNNSPSKHRDRTYPTGVWFAVWWQLAGNPYGHVALVAPDGRVYSTSNLAPNPLKVHPNVADVERYYAKYGHPLTYLGWTEDVAGYPVITPSGIASQGTVTKKDGFEMAEVEEVVEGIFNKKFKKGDGSGEVTLGQVVAWYDANRENDLDEIFQRKFVRGGGVGGEISLQSMLAYYDANLNKALAQDAAQKIQIEKLVGALAATAGANGQPFDQAKLLASITAAVKGALPTTVTFK